LAAPVGGGYLGVEALAGIDVDGRLISEAEIKESSAWVRSGAEADIGVLSLTTAKILQAN